MSSFALELLSTLGRTTLWLGLVGVVTAGLLRLARANSPSVHRAGCVLTLLVGWAFLQYSVAVPWYEMAAAGPESSQEPASVAVIDLQPDPLQAGQALDTAAPIDIADSPLEIAGATNPPLEQPDANAPIPEDITAPTQNLQVATSPTSAPSISVAAWLDRWPVALLALWAAGLLVLPAIWLVGYVRFVRSLRICRQPVDAWQSQWSELIGSAPLGRRIPLCVSDDVGPMLCRLPRGYVLVVPEPLWRELSDEGRRAILRHELAHYLRGDVWKSLAVRLLALPHWFNPLSWWAVRRFDEAAEWACDAAASADTRSTEYAKTLVRLGELSTADLRYGSAARGRTLAARVRRVLARDPQRDSRMKQSLLLALVLSICLLSLVQVRLIADPPEIPPAEEAKTKKGPASESPFWTHKQQLLQLEIDALMEERNELGKALDENFLKTIAESAPPEGSESRPMDVLVDIKLNEDRVIMETKEEITALRAWLDRPENHPDPGFKKNLERQVRALEERIEERKGEFRPRIVTAMTGGNRGGNPNKDPAKQAQLANTRGALLAEYKQVSGRIQQAAGEMVNEAKAAAKTRSSGPKNISGPNVIPATEIEAAQQGEKPGEPEQTSVKQTETVKQPEANQRAERPAAEPKPANQAKPGTDPEPAAKDAVDEAAQKMVKQAERAFEASLAAYEAETTTVEALYGWSLRWMRAVQIAAQTPKEKVAAAHAHLDRMRDAQKRIHLLFVSGSRGGEAKDEAAANYYVAEAERLVAETGTAPKTDNPLVVTGKAFEHQISDAKIALATDDADLLKAEARMQVAKEKFAAVTRAKPGAVAQVEIAHQKAEVQLLEAELKKLQYVRNLHEQNLARLQAAAQERIVAEAKAVAQAAPAPAQPGDAVSRQQQISDAKIALAVDEAELRATEARLQVAQERLATLSRVKPGTISAVELTQAKAEVRMLEASLAKFKQIRVLHEQNLARLLAVEQHRAAEAPAAPEPERKLLDSRAEMHIDWQPQRKLLYAGKSFDQWAEQLRTDLSPDSRTEAIRAIGVLGAHGKGGEAADAIVAAALESLRVEQDQDWNQAQAASLALQKLPPDNVLPRVKTLLSSDNARERLFGLQVARSMRIDAKEKEKLMLDLIDDPNAEVAHLVIEIFLDGNPVAPRVENKVRQLLASPEPSQVIFAAQAVTQVERRRVGQPLRDGDRQLLTTMMPDILKAMGRDEPIQSAIRRTLESIPTKDKLPGLKAALESDDPAVGERAEVLIKKIEGKQAPERR